MKGKLITLAGIVLIFGYFISESLRNPLDPNHVVMIGNDTLGRDWGAMAEQKIRDAAAAQNNSNGGGGQGSENDKNNAGQYGNGSLLDPNDDPYSRDKINSSNYTTIQDGSGREVVTGYDRPEEQENSDPYSSRHQKERNQIQEEPQVQYKE